MIAEVPWRKNEDEANMDGKRLKGEVVTMGENYKKMEEHVLVPEQCTQHVKIWRGKQAERLTKRTKTNWEE